MNFSILLNSEGKAKLTDFGLSKVKIATQTNTGVNGTPNWMVIFSVKLFLFQLINQAPEMFDNEAQINEKVDIYGFAMVLYEISTNSIPFSGGAAMQIITEVLLKKKRPIIPDECDSNIRKIIEETWNQEASKRPTIIAILAKLELIQF